MISKDRNVAGLSPLDLLLPSGGSSASGSGTSANKDAFDALLRGPHSDSLSRNKYDSGSSSANSTSSSSSGSRDDSSSRSSSASDRDQNSRRSDAAHDTSPSQRTKNERSDADRDDDSHRPDADDTALAGAAGVKGQNTNSADTPAENEHPQEGTVEANGAVAKGAKRSKGGKLDPNQVVGDQTAVKEAEEVAADTAVETAGQVAGDAGKTKDDKSAGKLVVDPALVATAAGDDASDKGATDAAAAQAKAEAASKGTVATAEPTVAKELNSTIVAAQKTAQASATTDVVEVTDGGDASDTKESDGGKTEAKSTEAPTAKSTAEEVLAATATDPSANGGTDSGDSGNNNSADPKNVPVAPAATSQVTAANDAKSSNTNSLTSVSSGPQPPRLPATLLGRSEAAAHARPATEVDLTRFVHRVARAFEAAQQRDGEVRLRLSPPELGSVKISMTVQDGVMVAKLETETTTAQALINDNLQALRDRLQEQGIRVERFDVDLMNSSTGGFTNPQDQAFSNNEGNAFRREEGRNSGRSTSSSEPRPRAIISPDSTNGLNVIV
ncbi:MAG: flagellar hook-length control protein FliK [Planctomycetaceae bacterium]